MVADALTTAGILAIDPGPTESAFVGYQTQTRRPVIFDKLPNEELLERIPRFVPYYLAIEMVASYGMAVGAEVFETVLWTGIFAERFRATRGCPAVIRRVYRREVKMHLCGSMQAKDANIRQAIIDRYGGKELAIGKKVTPGPLYGIAGDVWSALAVAITAAEAGA